MGTDVGSNVFPTKHYSKISALPQRKCYPGFVQLPIHVKDNCTFPGLMQVGILNPCHRRLELSWPMFLADLDSVGLSIEYVHQSYIGLFVTTSVASTSPSIVTER
jgi:hypothetical protein